MGILDTTKGVDPNTALQTPDLLRLEEAALNAWPALQQMLLDGWLLRFSGGYTKRSNSVNPLYDGSANPERHTTTGDTDARIALCEALYASQSLPPVFRITPLAQPRDLDARLAARGYRQFDTTHVLALDLTTWQAPGDGTTTLHGLALDAWLDAYAGFSGKPTSPLLPAILEAIIPLHHLACLRHDGQTVACGLAVAEPPYVGLFSLITSPALRRRGYGQALVAHLLAWGREQGATNAYLQVQDTNLAAQALYAKMGFREAYTYWYRVRD